MTTAPTQDQSFNLTTEPWVRVLLAQGRLAKLSLKEVFTRAPEIVDLAGDVATQDLAVKRLLLAIMHRSLVGPQNLREWRAFSQNWGLVVAEVHDYLDDYAQRFDARSPTEPFMQVADLRSAKGDVAGLERLIADVPTGHPFMTTRLGRGISQISWAEAVRWLIHAHAYDTSGIKTGAVGDPRVKGGRGYPEGTGWCGQIGAVHLVGETLADTLMLNLVVPSEIGVRSGHDDVPVWERPPLSAAVDETNGGQPRGLVDAYVWQARRIRLVGNPDAVTGVVLSYGDRMTPQNRMDVEPMTAWRFSEPQSKKSGRETYMPRVHDPERELWRGLSSLLPRARREHSGHDKKRPGLAPALMQWSAVLVDHDLLKSALARVRATGVEYGSQSSTFAEIIDDQLDVPARILTDADMSDAVLRAAETTEEAVTVLAQLARNIAYAEGASPDLAGGRGALIREKAYREIGMEFRRWLLDAAGSTGLDAIALWRTTLRKIVFRLGEAVVLHAAPDAWRGRSNQGRHIDLGLADVWFHRAVVKLLPFEESLDSSGEKEPTT